MKSNKTKIQKVATMFDSGKKLTTEGIAKRLYGETTYNTCGRVRAIISDLNNYHNYNIRLVKKGTYQN